MKKSLCLLMLLIRNWLLDTGFILENNDIISKIPVKKLLEMSNTEVSSIHQLSDHHLTVRGNQRQNVKNSAQLMSRKAGTALFHYIPGENYKDKKVAQDIGNFILLINNWFNIMNSYVLNAALPNKKPYGVELQQQNEVLNEIINVFSIMKCPNAKNKISGLQTFQKGVIISCKSLQRLYIYLKEKYDIKFILTHRFNQDSLESLFSQLRSRGGLNDHPTPLDVLYRLRMIILGKNPGVIVSNCNTYEVEPDEFIIAEVVRTAKVPVDIEPDPKSINYDLYNIEEDAELASLTSSNKIINIVEEDKGRISCRLGGKKI